MMTEFVSQLNMINDGMLNKSRVKTTKSHFVGTEAFVNAGMESSASKINAVDSNLRPSVRFAQTNETVRIHIVFDLKLKQHGPVNNYHFFFIAFQ